MTGPSLPTSAATPPVADQVRASIQANAQAPSLADWQMSPSHPEALFDGILSRREPAEMAALCPALESLGDSDLPLFEQEIERPANEPLLAACREALAARLRRHWARTGFRLSSIPGFQSAPTKLQLDVRVLDPSTGPELNRGGLADGEIAFTIDDGPHPDRTVRILDAFEAAGVRANYFCVGENAKSYPDLVALERARGHVTGSHSRSHRQLPKIAVAEAQDEITIGRELVAAAFGMDVPFFRFPYGARNAELKQFVRDQGMASFMWNMDSSDWRLRDPLVLLANVKKELDREKGGIVLFHDIQEQTALAMPAILEEVARRGMKAVLFVPPNWPTNGPTNPPAN